MSVTKQDISPRDGAKQKSLQDERVHLFSEFMKHEMVKGNGPKGVFETLCLLKRRELLDKEHFDKIEKIAIEIAREGCENI